MKKDYVAIARKAAVPAALASVAILTLVSGAPAQQPPAQAQKEVVVINTATQPVPVTGTLEVAGTTAVSGLVSAQQSGLWTIGIDPARNRVSLADAPSFFYDSNLGVVNDGAIVELGPFDLTGLSKLRIIGRAVNGDVTFRLKANGLAGGLELDRFEIESEGEGNVYHSRVYDAPPPSLSLVLTESGPGGSNYQVMLIGR